MIFTDLYRTDNSTWLVNRDTLRVMRLPNPSRETHPEWDGVVIQMKRIDFNPHSGGLVMQDVDNYGWLTAEIRN